MYTFNCLIESLCFDDAGFFVLFSGKTLKHVANSNEQDIDEAVLAARNSYRSWSKWTGFERGKVLKTAADLIRVKILEGFHDKM